MTVYVAPLPAPSTKTPPVNAEYKINSTLTPVTIPAFARLKSIAILKIYPPAYKLAWFLWTTHPKFAVLFE